MIYARSLSPVRGVFGGYFAIISAKFVSIKISLSLKRQQQRFREEAAPFATRFRFTRNVDARSVAQSRNAHKCSLAARCNVEPINGRISDIETSCISRFTEIVRRLNDRAFYRDSREIDTDWEKSPFALSQLGI